MPLPLRSGLVDWIAAGRHPGRLPKCLDVLVPMTARAARPPRPAPDHGLAIAQLSRVEGVDAVGVTRWQWSGARRERLAEIDGAARAGAAPGAPAADDSLFG